MARSALARSFDVLAVTTKEQAYRCWDTEWPDRSEDIPRVCIVSLCLGALAKNRPALCF